MRSSPRTPTWKLFLASRAISRDRKAEALRAAFQRPGQRPVPELPAGAQRPRPAGPAPGHRRRRPRTCTRRGPARCACRCARPCRWPTTSASGCARSCGRQFGREPVLDARVDPDLLGGLMVQVGDWLYDASVRTRLERIRNQLIERSSHAIQSQTRSFPFLSRKSSAVPPAAGGAARSAGCWRSATASPASTACPASWPARWSSSPAPGPRPGLQPRRELRRRHHPRRLPRNRRGRRGAHHRARCCRCRSARR